MAADPGDGLPGRPRRGPAGLQVTAAGDGFEITIRHLGYDTDQGGRVALPEIRALLTPVDRRYDKVVVDVPEWITFVDPRGRSVEIRLGRRRAGFDWDRLIEASTVFDIELEDIEIVAVDKPERRQQIARVSLKSDVREQDGMWSGPLRVAVGGLAIKDEEGGRFRLGEIAVSAEVTRADLIALRAYRDAVAGGEPADTTFPARPLFRDLKVQLSLDDLSFLNRGGTQVGLHSARYGLTLEDADRPVFDAQVDVGHEGLAVSGVGLELAALLPGLLDLQLLIDDIKADQVSRSVLTAALDAVLLGNSGPEREQGPLWTLADALTKAAAGIRINRGHFEGPAISGDLDGGLQADAEAIRGWVGQVTLRIYESTGINGAQYGAPLLDSLRDRAEVVDGGATLQFRLELLPDGSYLLNGQPLFPPQPADEQH